MLPPELARHPGYLLRRAHQVYSGLWLHLGDTDASSVQFGVLTLLNGNPGIDQRELGDLMQLDRSTIAEIVLRMERRGYLERVRDPDDRRRNILNLTPRGRDELAVLQPYSDAVAQALTGHLDEAERSELLRLLSLVIEAAEPSEG